MAFHRFRVLTEPGYLGESPAVVHDPTVSREPFLIAPFPEANPPNKPARGLVLPPAPISIYEEAPYSLPPAFRMLGFTIPIPVNPRSSSNSTSQAPVINNPQTTNLVGHCLLYRLKLNSVSQIDQRTSGASS